MSINLLPMLLSRFSGKIIAYPIDDVGAITGGGNDFGHVTTAALAAPETEDVEEKSRRPENYDETIRKETGTITQTVTFNSRTNSLGNIAIAMGGMQIETTQAAGNDGSPVEITAYKGQITPLGKKNLDPDNPPVVTGPGATPTYEEDVDYQIDYDDGELLTVEGGSIADEATIEITKTWLEYIYVTTSANTQLSKFWRLEIVNKNEIDGKREKLIFHKCTLEPSAELVRITEDATSYQDFGFEAQLSKLGEKYYDHEKEK